MAAPIYSQYRGNGGGGGGGGGVTTVGTFDSETPSANGAVIDGSTIYFQSASPTVPGMVNIAAQSFEGSKTFQDLAHFDAGVESTYFSYPPALLDVASAGFVRAANNQSISWRNQGNTANISLTLNTANTLLLDGATFAVDNSNAGGTQGVRVNNSDNTNTASNARLYLLTGGSSGGDPFIRMSISSAADWAMGVDNSDSDSWKLSLSTVVGTNDRFIVATAGPATFGGIIDDVKALKVGSGSAASVSNGTSGVTQMGISSEVTVSSGATTLCVGFYSAPTTLAASFTCATRVGFYSDVSTKGSGSTITRDVGYFVNQPNQGTNNASITDNNTFTGNYFIHSTSSSPSNLAGELDFSGGSGQNIRLITNNAGDIGDTDGTNTFANITAGTSVRWAGSSTAYVKLYTLSGTNGPGIEWKSGGTGTACELYQWSDGLLYMAFGGTDRVSFSSVGSVTAVNLFATARMAAPAIGNNWQTVVGTDGGSSTISLNISSFYLNPAGTLSTYTITMPAAPFDGQIVRITSSQVVTTLTVSANSGQTITAPLTAFTVGGFATWQYHSATSNWNRVG